MERKESTRPSKTLKTISLGASTISLSRASGVGLDGSREYLINLPFRTFYSYIEHRACTNVDLIPSSGFFLVSCAR